MTAYLDVSDADDLVALVTGLAAYKAAAADAKTAALLLASVDLDAAGRWQGRKYDPAQEREFPRIAYVGSDPRSAGGAAVIWDWNEGSQAAVVPVAIGLAVLWQADAILDGARDERMQAVLDGVTGRTVGSLRETFGAATPRILCQRADAIVAAYRLRQGRLL